MASSENNEERLKAALADRYRIEHEIGSGGMATVYLAEDLKHDRKVAVKVLKPELSAVVGGERFLSEIQTTAHLQHPNILPLFDSGEVDGQLFYVMPYVEGESLRDRLNRERQLPVEDAVRIAVEVAEALQAAHDDGVIHRDIKPANILLRKGKPLVADFGIALAVSAASGRRLTETGLSLGTPYYMSPEQASGDRDPDARSDVYSLGCVLYEMLTGEPPFPGATAQAVLARILTGGVVAPRDHRKSIPINVEEAVLKATEKLPADRFQTVEGFSRALGDPAFRDGVGVSAVRRFAGGRWRPVTVGLGVLAGALAATLAWVLLQPESPRPVQWFSLRTEGMNLGSCSMGITRDGLGMIFQAPGADGSDQLWLRRWNSLFPVPISGTSDAGCWTLSPDGSEIASGGAGGLRVTSIQGGEPRTLTNESAAEPKWGSDGFIYFTPSSHQGLRRVPAAGGPVEVVMEPEEGLGVRWFSHIRAELDIAILSAWDEEHWVEVLRISTGERKQIALGEDAYLTASGHLVFPAADGRLMAAPFDAESMEMRSPPVPVTENVYIDDLGNPFYSLSDRGDLLYWTGASELEEMELVWVTRSGEVSPVETGWFFDPGDNRGWSLSPDEGQVALKAVDNQNADIWIKELPHGPRRRLTTAVGEDRLPRWSPNGESIIFLSDRGGNSDIWSKRADGVGEATLLLDLEKPINEAIWSPDGEWLVFRAGGTVGSRGDRDIFGLRPGRDTIPQPLVVSAADNTGPALSPDGRWLAYASTESGEREVYVCPFPDSQGWRVQVSVGGGREPVWGENGRELYYVSGNLSALGPYQFWVATLDPGLPPGVVDRQVLFTLPEGFYFANTTTSYSVTGDGQRFLMARVHAQTEDAERELILVQNWVELMKNRVGG